MDISLILKTFTLQGVESVDMDTGPCFGHASFLGCMA